MEIVLAEPSRLARRIIGDMLESRGHFVHMCGDGQEALDVVGENPGIDVIIASFELPSICGLELCWEARILSQTRAPLYIIVMSSSSERSRLIEALDSGADDFIKKPPVEEELFARLRASERLIRTQKDVLRLAQTDPLTGVYNRRMLFSKLQQLLDDPQQSQRLSMVMLDIDRFKKVNDRYGHDIGDLVISQVATAFTVRPGIFGRIGGEEFGWILPRKSMVDAVEIAESARRGIEHSPIHCGQGVIPVTCSFGVAEYRSGESLNDLTKRADLAMYDAKNSGRNCVSTGPQTVRLGALSTV